jgi:hypothetical protein
VLWQVFLEEGEGPLRSTSTSLWARISSVDGIFQRG